MLVSRGTGSGQLFAARVRSAIFGWGLGLENFPPKVPNFAFFSLLVKKNLIGLSQKSTWVKDGSASYFLRVKIMLRLGKRPCLMLVEWSKFQIWSLIKTTFDTQWLYTFHKKFEFKTVKLNLKFQETLEEKIVHLMSYLLIHYSPGSRCHPHGKVQFLLPLQLVFHGHRLSVVFVGELKIIKAKN